MPDSDSYKNGREAPKRPASEKAQGTQKKAPNYIQTDRNVVETLKNRGKRIDEAVDRMERGE